MPAKHPKRPRDPNQLAKLIVDLATGEATEDRPEPPTPAQEFARVAGLKGGAARAKALTPEQRREIAKRAAQKRWGR
jgi:ribosomal protein L5